MSRLRLGPKKRNRPSARLILLLLLATLGLAPGCASGEQEDFAVFLIELEPADHKPATLDGGTLERRWVSTRLWREITRPPSENDSEQQGSNPVTPATRTLHVRLGASSASRSPASTASTTTAAPSLDPPASQRTFVLEIASRDIGRPRARDGELHGPLLVAMDRPGASFNFAGGALTEDDASEPAYGGIVRVRLQRGFVTAARQIESDATTAVLLEAALLGLDAPGLDQFHRLPMPLSLTQVIDLKRAEVGPESIAALHEAGYRFTVAELLAMTRANVSVSEAVAFRQEGFSFTAGQLIRLHQAGASPSYAAGLKAAGFAENVEQIIRLLRAGVQPDYAQQMRRLEVVRSDQDLIRLHGAGITPETVATFQKADYHPDVEQLLRLHRHDVAAEDALALRQTGYNFSLLELIELSRWNVPVDFTLALMSDDFEPLGSDEIVDLHLRRITPEMVHQLRQRRHESLPAVRAE